MKTTVVLEDDIYDALVRFSQETTNSKRKLSQTLNRIVADSLMRKKDMFGSTKIPYKLLMKDLRDKHDRFD